jgi:DNA-binding HxlR family transcriptional regulator
MKKYPVRCPVSSYQCVMDGHWKPMIVWYMRNGELRFKDFLQLLPDISTKVLSAQLKELEDDRIITRKSFKEIPPRVQYALTEYGLTLLPVIAVLRAWGFTHLQQHPAILHKESSWVNKLHSPLEN